MNWTTNWKLGVFATYPLPIAKLTAEGSLLYDIKGGAWRGINESIEINKYLYSLHYLSIYADVLYPLISAKEYGLPFSISALGGLYFSYLLGAEAEVVIIDVGTDEYLVNDRGKISDRFNPLDIGILAGMKLSYDLSKTSSISLTLRYTLGLLDINADDYLYYQNESFDILLGIAYKM